MDIFLLFALVTVSFFLGGLTMLAWASIDAKNRGIVAVQRADILSLSLFKDPARTSEQSAKLRDALARLYIVGAVNYVHPSSLLTPSSHKDQ